jgi:hypothetical protein
MSNDPLGLVLKNQSIIFDTILKIQNSVEDGKFSQGIILSALSQVKKSKSINDHEFKVFSQWGEDGIIQYLINSIEIKNKNFIEFGVEDFSEANCRFLLMKDNWSGFVIDGSEENIRRLRQTNLYWKHQIDAIPAFITRENVNDTLMQSGFDSDIGILSVDIDGNDYHVLEAITCVKPRILVCEFNAVFGPTRRISIPYSAEFQRTKAHYSNLYFGASLSAITSLAATKGYSLVGINSAAVNAFYVRTDLLNENVAAVRVEDVYTSSKFRESRGEDGGLTLISGEGRARLIKGMPVYNTDTKLVEAF